MRRYKKSEIATMKRMRKGGCTLKEIAQHFECSSSVVDYHTNKTSRENQKRASRAYYKKHGKNASKPKQATTAAHLEQLSHSSVPAPQPKNYAGPVAFVSGLAMIIVLLLVLAK